MEVEYELLNYDVTVDNSTIEPTADENRFDVTFTKNEFQVVGDNIYIPVVNAEDAPWLIDLIDGQVTATYQGNLDSLDQATLSLNNQIALAQNAQTAYESSIITSAEITAAVETLRTELVGTSGTVTVALATKVTESEATALANTAISASIDDGDINAKVGELNTAIANGDGANASRVGVVESTVNDPVTGVNATATGVVTLNSTVGLSGGVPNGTGVLGDVEILKKQNDGKIETFADTYQVVDGSSNLIETAEPYSTWRAADVTGIDTRLSHIGDSYIEYVTLQSGAKQYVSSYKFIRASVDNTSPDKTDAEGFTWALITDTATQEAFTAALSAQAIADGKITSFYAPRSTPPTAEGEGDIWVVSDEGNVQERWNGFVWANIRDSGILTAIADAASAQATADGKIDSFYQDTAPTVADEGDIWFDTDDGNKIYTRRADTWINTQDSKIGVALLNAATAQGTADGKVTTFYQSTMPTAEGHGDLWVDTDDGNKLYRWDANITTPAWTSIQDQAIVANTSAITQLDTELSNGTTTWASADSTLEQSLETKIDNDVATVESKFEYGTNIKINNVYYNSGFGLNTLATGGAGTGADPYDSEFWINAEKFRFTNSNQTGQVSPFTIDAGGVTPSITFNGKVTFGNVTGTENVITTSNTLVDLDSGANTLLGTAIQPGDPLSTLDNTATGYTDDTAANLAQGTANTANSTANNALVNTIYATGTTKIDGGKIKADSVTASQIAANSVSADRFSPSSGTNSVWSGGGLVSDNFDGNSHGNIGSPTTGFRLSSDATGSTTDPNLYGAYIKASTLETTNIKTSNGTYSGDLVFASSTAGSVSTNIFGSTYGTGHLPARMVKTSSFATITATADIYAPENTVNDCVLEKYDSNTGLYSVVARTSIGSTGSNINAQVILNYALIPSGIVANGFTAFRCRLNTGAGVLTNPHITFVLYNI